jgi:hypothetical protein
MAADDIEVIRMTAVEWDQALTNSLNTLGLTWEQLTEQAKMGDFSSLKARQLWLMAGGQGPNQSALAEDPGDVPKRMAEAIDETWTSEEDFDADKAARAALGVRDELVAHLSARVAAAEARVVHAEEGAQLSSELLANVQQELDALQEERARLKIKLAKSEGARREQEAAIEQVRELLDAMTYTPLGPPGTNDLFEVGRYEMADRVRALLPAALDATETTPTEALAL